MSFDVTTEVRKAVNVLPDGAAVTLNGIFETFTRMSNAGIDKFTAADLRMRIQKALNQLRDESVITLERVNTDRGPAVYRKGATSRTTERTEPQQAVRPQSVMLDKNEDKKMPKFNFSVGAEVRRIIESMKEGSETDLQRIYEPLVAAHPVSQSQVPMLRTYISQALKPLKGKLVIEIEKSIGGKPAIFRRIGANGKPAAIVEKPSKPTVTNGHSPYRSVIEDLCRQRDEIGTLIALLEKRMRGGGGEVEA